MERRVKLHRLLGTHVGTTTVVYKHDQEDEEANGSLSINIKEMTVPKEISEYFRQLAKKRHDKNPISSEQYSAMGKKSKRGKAKRPVDNSLK